MCTAHRECFITEPRTHRTDAQFSGKQNKTKQKEPKRFPPPPPRGNNNKKTQTTKEEMKTKPNQTTHEVFTPQKEEL